MVPRDPGPRLVDALEIAVTVIALHVALGRYGEVYPAYPVSRSRVETGVMVMVHGPLLICSCNPLSRLPA